MLAVFNWDFFTDDISRLGLAALIGGALGCERQLHGHWAGLRTHMMVAIGSAMFVMAGMRLAGNQPADVARIIQGIASGIGFLGAGTILKLGDRMEIKGLTTASSIWLAAGLGVAAGAAEYTLAAAATCVSLTVLVVLHPLDRFLNRRNPNHNRPDSPEPPEPTDPR
jgi:putative Mg2+ transporter-C (MgtC) family protein